MFTPGLFGDRVFSFLDEQLQDNGKAGRWISS